ncbi:MAG: exodeoxyribonuclease III [Ruminococcaceae bacterium]|nr:exodeoxyribonuclease III [Oscillospiraceae bacterium]
MKLISWNVNGIRACIKKGFEESFNLLDADIFCLQETKLQEGQVELSLPGYEQFWCYADKKGYSGTAVFTRLKPLSVEYNISPEEHATEGRVLTLEFEEFFLVCVYTPNAQDGLRRLPYRLSWDEAFREHVNALDAKKPVVICGDLNVAHNEIDLANPDTNRKSPGFSDEERQSFGELLDSGFTDTFRHIYPDRVKYSWWSYRTRARERDVGWRIDYFLISDRACEKVSDATIHTDIHGSDHCPVGLLLKC